MLAFALASAPARADGDPASDVLLRDNVFYPYNDPVSPRLRKALDAATAAASDAHFPIKVALIQSSMDLGAVPSMFGRPQTYADFLEQEIAAGAPQPLLVVMAKGYGVQGIGTTTAALAGSLARPAGGESDDLARAAIAAIEALAARSGHRIDPSPQSSAALGGGRRSVPLELAALGAAAIIAAGALVALRTRRRWLWSERVRVQPGGASLPGGSRRSGRRGTFGARDRLGARDVLGRASVQPLSTVAAVLVCAGLVWAAARGLEFYGVTPLDVGYDLDQPPLLLVLVGAWLWYRSRRR